METLAINYIEKTNQDGLELGIHNARLRDVSSHWTDDESITAEQFWAVVQRWGRIKAALKSKLDNDWDRNTAAKLAIAERHYYSLMNNHAHWFYGVDA